MWRMIGYVLDKDCSSSFTERSLLSSFLPALKLKVGAMNALVEIGQSRISSSASGKLDGL